MQRSWAEHEFDPGRWSERHVLDKHVSSWGSSSFWKAARRDARLAVIAAGAGDSSGDALEVVFFGRRLARPGAYATGSETAARMLELACVS